jgi:hypothetical protein
VSRLTISIVIQVTSSYGVVVVHSRRYSPSDAERLQSTSLVDGQSRMCGGCADSVPSVRTVSEPDAPWPLGFCLYDHRVAPMGRHACIEFVSLKSSLVNLPVSLYGPLLERSVVRGSTPRLQRIQTDRSMSLAPTTSRSAPYSRQPRLLRRACYRCRKEGASVCRLVRHGLRILARPVRCAGRALERAGDSRT